ncbi:bifunctional metallophosphatase/5'-nucleotidase [bacterium]|nr:bifunctional metallophosphatase/5'-nucleotidase [bacterium]
MKFKVIFCWIFTVSFLLLGCKGETKPTERTVAILTTADLQSHIVSFRTTINGVDIIVGGFERIAAAAKKVRSEVDVSLLLSSGDDLIPPLLYVFKGEPEVKGLSMAGYDVVTPGNHEFDAGVEVYKHALGFADFDVVSANISFDDQDLNELVKPYVVKDINGLKIGIFGLMTPDFSRVCNPPGGGVSVNVDYISAAESAVQKLEDQGCDIIIALTHIGTMLDRNLASTVDGIDIIVGGHSHEYIYEVVGNTIIVQDGSKGEYLGVLRFVYSNGEIKDPYWETILLDSTVGCDTTIRNVMNQYMAAYDESLGQTIGTTTVALEARKEVIRSRESNLGNLIADSWLEWFGEADVALVNSGSIRGDKVYPAGAITMRTVNEMLPFRNEVIIARMSGAQLKQVLEISASALRIAGDGCPDSCRASTGGFMQIGNLKVTIDTTKAPFCAVYSGRGVSEVLNYGERVVDMKVLKDGSWVDVDSTQIYTVLVNDWTASGGDGYYMFVSGDVEIEHTTVVATDILSNYIRLHSPISPEIEGRIAFLPR